MANIPGPDIDCYTYRPRHPNDQYSILTDEQISNIHKEPLPLFHSEKYTPSCVPPPFNKYCAYTSKHLVRQAGAEYYGWINDKYQREPPEEYDTCRGRASVRWGPNKAGERTRSHFFGEQVDRYTTIDMYRRPATNIPGQVYMNFGRPVEGYYAQKNPSRVTCFRASMPLNRTAIMQSVGRKTKAEYERLRLAEAASRVIRTDDWPEYTEYTDRFLLNTKVPPSLNGLQANKMHVLSSPDERHSKP